MKIFSSAFSAFKVHADRVAEGFGYAVHFVPKASLSSSIRTEGTSTQQAAVPLSPETDVGDSGYDHAFYIPPTLETGLSSSVEVDAKLAVSKTGFSSAFSAFKAYVERVAEGFGYAVHFVPKASLSPTGQAPAAAFSGGNIAVSELGSTLRRRAQLRTSIHYNESRCYLACGLFVELEPSDTDMEIPGIDVNGSNAYVTVVIDGNGTIKIEPEVELPEDDCLFVGTALTSPVDHRIPYHTIPVENIPDDGNVAPTTFAVYRDGPNFIGGDYDDDDYVIV